MADELVGVGTLIDQRGLLVLMRMTFLSFRGKPVEGALDDPGAVDRERLAMHAGRDLHLRSRLAQRVSDPCGRVGPSIEIPRINDTDPDSALFRRSQHRRDVVSHYGALREVRRDNENPFFALVEGLAESLAMLVQCRDPERSLSFPEVLGGFDISDLAVLGLEGEPRQLSGRQDVFR